MAKEQHRHDISERAWEKSDHTPLAKRGHLAGLAGDVWKLEECSPTVLPVA